MGVIVKSNPSPVKKRGQGPAAVEVTVKAFGKDLALVVPDTKSESVFKFQGALKTLASHYKDALSRLTYETWLWDDAKDTSPCPVHFIIKFFSI